MARDIAPYSPIKCRRRPTGPERTSDFDTSRAGGAPEEEERHRRTLYDALLPRKPRGAETAAVRRPCPRAAPWHWRRGIGGSSAGELVSRTIRLVVRVTAARLRHTVSEPLHEAPKLKITDLQGVIT